MIPKVINICGVPHAVKLCKDTFNSDCIHFGEINYKNCEILLADDVAEELQMQTLIHEWLHGVLFMTGFPNDYRGDERLVQSLAMAIYQTFTLKETANG